MVWLCFMLHKRRNGSVLLVSVDVDGLGDDRSGPVSMPVLWYEFGSYLSWKESGGGTISDEVLSLIKHVVFVLLSLMLFSVCNEKTFVL